MQQTGHNGRMGQLLPPTPLTWCCAYGGPL